jgi:hypothetical protein
VIVIAFPIADPEILTDAFVLVSMAVATKDLSALTVPTILGSTAYCGTTPVMRNFSVVLAGITRFDGYRVVPHGEGGVPGKRLRDWNWPTACPLAPYERFRLTKSAVLLSTKVD